MSLIDTFPMTRLSTGTIDPDGVDLVIASAGVDLPEAGYGSYVVGLHEDGAHCSIECGCVDAEDRTTIWEGTTVTYGEWTWHASRYALIGWHSTGPAKPELIKRVEELEERAEVLFEDLDAERGNHRTTAADLNHNIVAVKRLAAELEAAQADAALLQRNIDTVCGERDEALGWLSGAEAAHLDTRDKLGTYRTAAWSAAVVALLLAFALVWAVIA